MSKSISAHVHWNAALPLLPRGWDPLVFSHMAGGLPCFPHLPAAPLDYGGVDFWGLGTHVENSCSEEGKEPLPPPSSCRGPPSASPGSWQATDWLAVTPCSHASLGKPCAWRWGSRGDSESPLLSTERLLAPSQYLKGGVFPVSTETVQGNILGGSL